MNKLKLFVKLSATTIIFVSIAVIGVYMALTAHE